MEPKFVIEILDNVFCKTDEVSLQILGWTYIIDSTLLDCFLLLLSRADPCLACEVTCVHSVPKFFITDRVLGCHLSLTVFKTLPPSVSHYLFSCEVR